MAVILNTTVTSDGNTTVDGNGKLSAFLASGTFGGATVKLQHQVGANWVDLGTETTLTEAGGAQFITPQGSLRVNVSSAGGSTSVTVIVKPIVA
jgi:hypothetical protein